VISALSAVYSTASNVFEKFGSMFHVWTVLALGMTGFIPVVKMETRKPVDGYFGSEFLAICNYGGLKSQGIKDI